MRATRRTSPPPHLPSRPRLSALWSRARYPEVCRCCAGMCCHCAYDSTNLILGAAALLVRQVGASPQECCRADGRQGRSSMHKRRMVRTCVECSGAGQWAASARAGRMQPSPQRGAGVTECCVMRHCVGAAILRSDLRAPGPSQSSALTLGGLRDASHSAHTTRAPDGSRLETFHAETRPHMSGGLRSSRPVT